MSRQERQDPLAAISRAALEQAKLGINREVFAAKRLRGKRKTRAGMVRLTLDVPRYLAQALERAAKRRGCSVSAVVAWAAATVLAEHGPDDLLDVLRPSRAPRFEFVLDEAALERVLRTERW